MGHPVIVDINKAIKSFGLEIDMPDADHAPYVADKDTTAGANACALCGRVLLGKIIVVPDLKRGKFVAPKQGYLCLDLATCTAHAAKKRSEKDADFTSKLNSLAQQVTLPKGSK